MHSLQRVLIFLAVFALSVPLAIAQQQDKQQSKDYMEQAEIIMAETKAMDDAREIMVTAADYDTTNVPANFEAGHMHLLTINKDRATKYFMRVYRQNPNYKFDLEYWIGKGFQMGLDFNNAIQYYTRYKDKLLKDPGYSGTDRTDMKEVERRLTECQNGKEFVAHPGNYSITNVGQEINSEFEDFAPVLAENESEIIFTTRRRDGNTNENVAPDNKPYEDVFASTKTGASWTRAKNIGGNVNSKFNNSSLAVSPDGGTLFLYNDNGAGDIYFCERQKDSSWGLPQPLPGMVNSSFRESSITITKDGATLYFASERPGGLGGLDIYAATKDSKGEWTRIRNLGPTINSTEDEDGPFIDNSGKTLYFSSRGKKGMGGFDIFKSTLTDATKNTWSEPENLGFPINTPDDDSFYVTSSDGKRGYYSSVRDDGFGYSDIYVITVADAPKPKKEPEKIKAKPLIYLVKVVDAETKKPLESKVRLQSLKDNVVIGVEPQFEGEYQFTITAESPNNYKLSVEREGYIFVNQTVPIEGASAESKTVTKTVELRKIVEGARSVLRNIYFDFDKASFKTESYAELNKLEAMMKQNSSTKVEIGGHTDVVGTKDFNKQLSVRRANAVRAFLTSKGIDPRRVTAVGYGKEKPLASNDDEKEGRELNRRVEFKVLAN
jgi:outer membrane protein OmpA-like peptidoglycan-associated protein